MSGQLVANPTFDYKPQPWATDAACADFLPGEDWWHPEGHGLAVKAQEKYAKEICRQCPVRLKCLEYALMLDEATPWRSEGIWGGLNGGERDALRKQGKRAC